MAYERSKTNLSLSPVTFSLVGWHIIKRPVADRCFCLCLGQTCAPVTLDDLHNVYRNVSNGWVRQCWRAYAVQLHIQLHYSSGCEEREPQRMESGALLTSL